MKNIWPLKTLVSISEKIDYGVTASADREAVGPRFLRITDIQDGNVNWATVPFCRCDPREQKNKELKSGDIVFARTGATTGKSFLIKELPKHSVFASYLIRITPSKEIDPNYLYHFFQTENYWNQITKGSRGAGQPGVNSTNLGGLIIPVPPIPKQRKIADILDRVDAVRQRHAGAQRLVGDFVPAVFEEMFGEKHHFESQLLGDMTVFRTSGSRGWAQYYSDSGAIFLRIQNVKDTKLHLDKVAYVKPPNSAESKRTRVEPGDILISITADLGRIGVIPHNIGEAYINQHLVLVRLKEGFFPEYIAGYLASRAGQASLLKRNKSGVKAGLNFDDIDTLRIPVPPIALQKRYLALRAEGERIVSTIERRGTLVDEFSDSLPGTMFE